MIVPDDLHHVCDSPQALEAVHALTVSCSPSGKVSEGDVAVRVGSQSRGDLGGLVVVADQHGPQNQPALLARQEHPSMPQSSCHQYQREREGPGKPDPGSREREAGPEGRHDHERRAERHRVEDSPQFFARRETPRAVQPVPRQDEYPRRSRQRGNDELGRLAGARGEPERMRQCERRQNAEGIGHNHPVPDPA